MDESNPLPFLTTQQAAKALGVSYGCLSSAIRRGRIPAPRKDPSGNFLWFEPDLKRARQGLAVDRRRRQAVPS
jgi:hypothetical protein